MFEFDYENHLNKKTKSIEIQGLKLLVCKDNNSIGTMHPLFDYQNKI